MVSGLVIEISVETEEDLVYHIIAHKNDIIIVSTIDNDHKKKLAKDVPERGDEEFELHAQNKQKTAGSNTS